MLDLEKNLRCHGYQWIIGIDEAGRGPLAGPVVASAVCLKAHCFTVKIADSKTLSPQQRLKAFHEIYENADVGVGIVAEQVIDRINILQATLLAMHNAICNVINRINVAPHYDPSAVHLLIDGNYFKNKLDLKHQTVIKGDKHVLSIACASIIAKVTRDRILEKYDQIFPEYGFAKHKGYPTAAHRQAILKFGPSTIHRRSFTVKK